MSLIELFSDYVYNQKDLKEYVEKRKKVKERGEFNDNLLFRAADNLEKLKSEDREVYDLMYITLEEYVKLDQGHTLEYPINFIREILKLHKQGCCPRNVYEDYKAGLTHPFQDA